MKQTQIIQETTFSLKNTQIAKGIGIILLIWHHLFYVDTPLFNDYYIANIGLAHITGKIFKFCVAVFVFLSGYGLAINYDRYKSILYFYKRNIAKILINYWFIWIIFVPICIFAFNIGFEDVYGENYLFKFLIDLLGLKMLFPSLLHVSYNATWWFMSLIIFLYLLFPFLNLLIKRTKILGLIITIAIIFIPLPAIFDWISIYLYPMAFGVYFAQNGVFEKVKAFKYKYLIIIASLILICIAVYFREATAFKFDVYIDGIIGTLVITLLYLCISTKSYLGEVLDFLGKYSMDMFLTHTFIQGMWFENIIYYTKDPLISFATLLTISLLVAIVLDKIKIVIKLNRLYP